MMEYFLDKKNGANNKVGSLKCQKAQSAKSTQRKM